MIDDDVSTTTPHQQSALLVSQQQLPKPDPIEELKQQIEEAKDAKVSDKHLHGLCVNCTY